MTEYRTYEVDADECGTGLMIKIVIDVTWSYVSDAEFDEIERTMWRSGKRGCSLSSLVHPKTDTRFLVRYDCDKITASDNPCSTPIGNEILKNGVWESHSLQRYKKIVGRGRMCYSRHVEYGKYPPQDRFVDSYMRWSAIFGDSVSRKFNEEQVEALFEISEQMKDFYSL